MRDFTLDTYKALLDALMRNGYRFVTYAEYCSESVTGRYVILRHDIDKSPKNALAIARIEHALGVRSTFYALANRSVFVPEIIHEIASLGHEVGYHYRDLVDAKGDAKRAIASFEKNLSAFRAVTDIKTISMDGCPWSKYDNRRLWQHYDYHDYGIIGEPYFEFLKRNDVVYLTDTARMWDGDRYNVRDKRIVENNTNKPQIHSTFELINWLKDSDKQTPIMITTHPQRWTNNRLLWWKELCTQHIKNIVKQILYV